MKLIMSTAPEGEAAGIGETLLTERLVACVNFVPGVRSRYWWKGALEEAGETVLLMKTTEALAERAVARLVELHSYDVPEAAVLDIEGGNAAYLEWIAEVTTDDGA
jgi:periplasmic divalent cation tolerance protein